MCDKKPLKFISFTECDIKTKIFQDFTNDYITNVKYFDINTIPLEFNYSYNLQHKSNVSYCN